MNRCLLLAATFIITNLVLWLPWLITDDIKFSLEGGKEVFNRIFPVRRGIFEDKVASFWCVLHYLTPLKPQNWYDNSFNFKMTMGTTFLSCIPSCYLLYKAPSAKQFLCSLFCISMLFFIFGFQVHEKQILSPCLIFALMMSSTSDFITVFTLMTNFSMLMLYTNDFNHINYIALQLATFFFGRQFEKFIRMAFT